MKDLQEIVMPSTDEANELVCYFYAKEVSENQFKAIEAAQLSAIEWGKEVQFSLNLLFPNFRLTFELNCFQLNFYYFRITYQI